MYYNTINGTLRMRHAARVGFGFGFLCTHGRRESRLRPQNTSPRVALLCERIAQRMLCQREDRVQVDVGKCRGENVLEPVQGSPRLVTILG
jgi:hypothetical protein